MQGVAIGPWVFSGPALCGHCGDHRAQARPCVPMLVGQAVLLGITVARPGFVRFHWPDVLADPLSTFTSGRADFRW